jgi:hypothetical protein
MSKGTYVKTNTVAAFAALASCLVLTSTRSGQAYNYNTCNGTPVTDSLSHIYFQFDEQCSLPVGSSQWNAAIHGVGEYDNVLGSGFMERAGSAGNSCVAVQGDGVSEVALANPAAIGGNNGLTLIQYSACNLFSTQQIIEADVFAANTLDFGWPDETWVGSNFHCQTAPLSQQTGQCDIGLGNLTLLHEMGHSIGLQHSPGQVIMHNGPPVPYAGGSGGVGTPRPFSRMMQTVRDSSTWAKASSSTTSWGPIVTSRRLMRTRSSRIT